MNQALIYRPNNRELTWTAFVCAIMIHLGAIAIAGNSTRPITTTWGGDPDVPVIGTIDPPPQTQEPELVLPPDQPPSVMENDFYEVNHTPPLIRPRKKTPVTPVTHPIGTGTTTAAHGGSVKALTLYAPKPSYPYEARRGGITGTGVAQLTVNSATGNVINARMAQCTGSAILDRATLEALQRWRFKPGVAENIDVPVTYTLTGISY